MDNDAISAELDVMFERLDKCEEHYEMAKEGLHIIIRDSESFDRLRDVDGLVMTHVGGFTVIYEVTTKLQSESPCPLFTVSKDQLARWGISAEQLHEDAVRADPESAQILDIIADFNKAKDRLYIRLYDPDLCNIKNPVLITRPARLTRALKITYALNITAEHGQAPTFVSVSKVLLMGWGITEEQLYQAAIEQETKRGHSLCILSEITQAIISRKEGQEPATVKNLFDTKAPADGLMVLSTNGIAYGSSVLDNRHILKKVGALLKDDFYVIPSSVHEVMVLRTSDPFPLSDIKDMLRNGNVNNVPSEAVLSFKVFVFRRKAGTLNEAG